MSLLPHILLFSLLISFINSNLRNLENEEIIPLPEPEKEGGMPLYEALNKRMSKRDFNSTAKVDSKILSQSLWACYGYNRQTKFKTTPSAKAWYPLDVYVFLEEGVFKYNATSHSLIKKVSGDYRKLTGTQNFVSNAGVNFVIIADFNKSSTMDDAHKLRSIYLDTGHCTMALGLYAAANNMKGVDRAMVDDGPILELLGLNKDDYIFTLAFSLGY